MIAKEVRKRAEAAEAFAGAGRAEQAAKEEAEAAVLNGYLPTPLTDDEIAGLVSTAVDDVAASTGGPVTMRQMGLVIKAVQAARRRPRRRIANLRRGEGRARPEAAPEPRRTPPRAAGRGAEGC